MRNFLNKKRGWRLIESSPFCICLLILLTSSLANAQVNPVQVKPLSSRIVSYLKTPQHAARATKYKNSIAKPYSKYVKFSDGGLHITYSKGAPNNQVSGAPHKTVKSTKKSTSGGLICTTTVIALDANSPNFLIADAAAAASNIYPGAVYTIQNLTNGTYQQQQGARNPVVITTDNPNTTVSSVTVQNPNMGTINPAIAQIYRGFGNGSGQEELAYQVSQADNSSEYNLAIGAAASGYGVDLGNQYSTGNQSVHVHLTIDAMKTMFSINMVPPDNGIFVDPTIEANPDMTYIAEVSYGIRVLANADITFSSQADADDFKASFSDIGFSASFDLDYKNMSKSTNTTINGYIIGGAGNQVIAYSLADLKTQINKTFATATYASARPISYKAFSMDDQQVGSGSLTDDFPEQNCVAADGGVPEIQNIELTFNEGPDAKDAKTAFSVLIIPGLTGSNNLNTMFAYNMPANTQQFANNATNLVVLSPAVGGAPAVYTGHRDVTAFAKANGGRIVISAFANNGYDIWQITGITVNVVLKPSAGSSAGAGPPVPLKYSFTGANMISLDTRSNTTNTTTLYFDANMKPYGPGASQ